MYQLPFIILYFMLLYINARNGWIELDENDWFFAPYYDKNGSFHFQIWTCRMLCTHQLLLKKYETSWLAKLQCNEVVNILKRCTQEQRQKYMTFSWNTCTYWLEFSGAVSVAGPAWSDMCVPIGSPYHGLVQLKQHATRFSQAYKLQGLAAKKKIFSNRRSKCYFQVIKNINL